MAKAKKNKESIYVKGLMYFSLLLLLLSLFSLFTSDKTILQDYELLKNSQLAFKDYITLSFPDFKNPIGIFGVFTSYFLLLFFGKFFGMIAVLTAFSFTLFSLLKLDNIIKAKIILMAIFSYNLSFIRILLNNNQHSPRFILKHLMLSNKMIGETGGLLLSIFLCLSSIVLIFGINTMKQFFAVFFTTLANLLDAAVEKGKKIRNEHILTIDNNKIIDKNKVKEIEYEEINENNENNPKQNELTINDHAKDEKKESDTIATQPEKFKKRKINAQEASPYEEYTRPNIDHFLADPVNTNEDYRKELEKNIITISKVLTNKLAEFRVQGEVVNVNIGPIITQYEIKPAPGIKVSRFSALSDDLALAIKARSIRVQAPIPGRGLIGIEVPNSKRDIIYLKDILLSEQMSNLNGTLSIALGKDIAGNPVVTDLSKTPHLLIAGATGSGKSVCINTLINSLLLQYSPDELRLIMIDPKRIELSGYEGVPHLVQEVVTEPEHALSVLNWGVAEMERRYQLLQKYNVREIKSYNKKILEIKKDDETIEDIEIPYIVMIVDEFADLMMTAGKEIEQPIARLAQMARAIGIHLILATQRPSTKVITGVIKANFPARIAFQVSSKIDSRVILDSNGAEKLLGRGDMLFLPPGKGFPERIHGAYMSDDEIENLVEYLRLQPKPEHEITLEETDEIANIANFEYDDDLFPEAAKAVVFANSASVSMLQRHFKIGYARAGRLVDMLEKAGIVGPHVGSKSRDVLTSEEDLKSYGFIQEI